ncbi:MAG: hypothetical protein HND48_17340 [Chloroflexi bacterium]|nr:hypothetical protein [Chloroflexota bacterium]
MSAVKPVTLSSERGEHKASENRALRRFLAHRGAVIGAILLALILLYVTVGSLIFSEADANFADYRAGACSRHPPSIRSAPTISAATCSRAPFTAGKSR